MSVSGSVWSAYAELGTINGSQSVAVSSSDALNTNPNPYHLTTSNNLTAPTSTADFLNAFHFTVSNNGLGEDVSATINWATLTHINGLQARLYSTSSDGAGGWILAPSDTTKPSVSNMIQAWGLSFSSGVAPAGTDILNQNHLGDGEYILEFRGKDDGKGGKDSYEGHVSYVPLPAALWLFVGGFGLLGYMGRSRRYA
jgi:hypothetical protein